MAAPVRSASGASEPAITKKARPRARNIKMHTNNNEYTTHYSTVSHGPRRTPVPAPSRKFPVLTRRELRHLVLQMVD